MEKILDDLSDLDKSTSLEKILRAKEQGLDNQRKKHYNKLKELMISKNTVIMHVIEDVNTFDRLVKEIVIIDLSGNELLNRIFSLSSQFCECWTELKELLKDKTVLLYDVDHANYVIEKTLHKCSIFEIVEFTQVDLRNIYAYVCNHGEVTDLSSALNEEQVAPFLIGCANNDVRSILDLAHVMLVEHLSNKKE